MAALYPGSRADAPRLKTDVGYMKFISKEADWEKDVKGAGDGVLCIVDVYNPNWGPCEMLAGHFTNMFFDKGDDYGMRFVRADASKITDLIEFRDKSEAKALNVTWTHRKAGVAAGCSGGGARGTT